MTKSEQIAFIRQKCIEVNPEKADIERSWGDVQQPIRLADVLLAIQEQGEDKLEFDDAGNAKTVYRSALDRMQKATLLKLIESWFGNDDLTLQSEETLSFLVDLLKDGQE